MCLIFTHLQLGFHLLMNFPELLVRRMRSVKEQILAWCISVLLLSVCCWSLGAPGAAGVWKAMGKDIFILVSFFQAKEVAEQVLLSVLDTLGLAQLKSALRWVFPELLIWLLWGEKISIIN